MATKDDSNSSDKKKASAKKKAGAAGKKRGAVAKKGRKGGKEGGGRGTPTRDAQTPWTVEQLVEAGMLIEKSKHPLSYLIGTRTPNNESIWLCWPTGEITLDDLCGEEEGMVVLIEKSKGEGP